MGVIGVQTLKSYQPLYDANIQAREAVLADSGASASANVPANASSSTSASPPSSVSGVGKSMSPTDYLFGLQKKFPDLHITIGTSYSGSGVSNVSISPVILEKMAENPDEAAKYEDMISGIPQATEWLQAKHAADGTVLKSHGTVIDSKGDMSSWSETGIAPAVDSASVEGPTPSRDQTALSVATPTSPASALPPPQADITLWAATPETDITNRAHTSHGNKYSKYLTHNNADAYVPQKGTFLQISG